MKIRLGIMLAGLIVSLSLLFSSCEKMENKSDGDWIGVSVNIQKPGPDFNEVNRSVVADDGSYTYPTVLITAVSGSLSAVDPDTVLGDNYGQALLGSDNSVTFTLPVGSPVRLVRAHFSGELTLSEAIAGDVTPLSIAVSEPFSVDANTTRTTVQIEMPSITLNVDKDTYVNGVYTLSATGSKAFDATYWGSVESASDDMDEGMNYLYDNTRFFLSNSNRTISVVRAFQYPLPFYYGDDYSMGQARFADGSFPARRSHTGLFRPKRVTAAMPQYVYHDYNGNAFDSSGWDWSYPKYTFQYDSSTGYPTGGTMTIWDPSTNAMHTDENEAYNCPNGNKGFVLDYTFEPRSNSDHRNYLYTGYTVKDASGTPQCVYSVSMDGEHTAETTDYSTTVAWYDADGSTLISGQDTAIESVPNAAKWIQTTVLNGNVMTTTEKWYDSSDSEFQRNLTSVTFNDIDLHLPSSVSFKIFSVSSGVTTLTTQLALTYENGFVAESVTYDIVNGTASGGTVTAYTRDSQGRLLQEQTSNISGSVYYQIDYTLDSSNRRSTSREYSVSGGTKTQVCSLDANKDYTYSSDSSGNDVLTIDSYCFGSELYDTPIYRTVTTYNELGLKISELIYSKVGGGIPVGGGGEPSVAGDNRLDRKKSLQQQVSHFPSFSIQTPQLRQPQKTIHTAGINHVTVSTTWELIDQHEWEYNASGAVTKDSYYAVTDGVASLNYYETYEYDSNRFITAFKRWDADGDLHYCPDCTVGDSSYYKCKDQPSMPCYEVRSYTYE